MRQKPNELTDAVAHDGHLQTCHNDCPVVTKPYPPTMIPGLLERRKNEPRQLSPSDGPFEYQYVAICHVLGGIIPAESTDPIEIANFPEVGGRAFLTRDQREYREHLDRATALGALLLKGIFGMPQRVRGWEKAARVLFGPEWVFTRRLHSEIEAVRAERRKKHPDTACYLIYLATERLTHAPELNAARYYTEMGIALGALDRSLIKAKHLQNVRNASTAVSVALSETGGSPDTEFLADDVFIVTAQGVPIYLRDLHAGSSRISVANPLPTGFPALVDRYASSLASDRKLQTAASLFAMSQHWSNDNLRRFIAAWSALELLINTIERRNRDAFQGLLRRGDPRLTRWDRDLRDVHISEYRLRDKFFAAALVLNPNDAESDSQVFAELNDKRGAYYHRLEISEKELPALDVQRLFRKYIKLLLV